MKRNDNSMTSSIELFNRLAVEDRPAGHENQLTTGIEVEKNRPATAFLDDENNFGLCIPAGEDEYSRVKPDVRSSAISLTKLRKNRHPEIRLTLHDGSQLEVFSRFIDEILEYLQGRPENRISGVAQRLVKWRHLFALGQTKRSFDPNIEVGLLCELEVLNELLERGESVSSWTGPNFEHHDFKLADESVEGKATTSQSSFTVEIHGASQLTTSPGKNLVLLVRRYTPDPSGSLSVPKLIEEILGKTSGETDLFLAKLLELGYDINNPKSEANCRSFFPNGSVEFDVTDEFPRIPEQVIGSRIQSVRYLLDLSNPESIPGYREINDFLE